MVSMADQKFLNRHFRSVYNKLEADALLFNRRLPHELMRGKAGFPPFGRTGGQPPNLVAARIHIRALRSSAEVLPSEEYPSVKAWLVSHI
jgi:hypothetical protein